jgi:hypothetical protein
MRYVLSVYLALVSIAAGAPSIGIDFVGAKAGVQAERSADGAVVYRDAWRGIDVCYRGMKSEYWVAAGADPELIRIRYGVGGYPLVRRDGSLLVIEGNSVLEESAPLAYQEGHSVPAEFRVFADGTVGFALGPYDRSLPLVIDPVMSYSTLFGGSAQTEVTAVAADDFGNAIIAGYTNATDLPANGAKTKNAGGLDAFVAKFVGAGNQLAWCTYLGGSSDDRAFGVAVDAGGNVYVTGWTYSANFPLVKAAQSRFGGGRDAFVTKLDPSGTMILYSTYLGGSNYDQGNAIAVDSQGNAYITGDTLSTNFPMLNAYQWTSRGQQEVFVVKLNAAGSSLLFSTYLGGGGDDHGAAIAVDRINHVYVAGSTYSTNFPIVAATQPRIGGGQDAFVAEFRASGSALVFSTYIGGSNGAPGLTECANAVAVDGDRNLYVAGQTSSYDFPTTSASYQRSISYGGAEDHGFAWKLNAARTQVLYSTYIAGTNADQITAMAVDPPGSVYLAGYTSSPDFPSVRAFQAALAGNTNGFVLKLNPAGTAVVYSSFLGGSNSDSANAIAIDSRQNVLVAGVTMSNNFPVFNAAQTTSYGPITGFVTRVAPGWYPIVFDSGTWYLDTRHDSGFDGYSGNVTKCSFGQTGDQPIVGDWGSTGSAKIGVFRNGLWILDSNGNGSLDVADRQFSFGQAGDIPVVGDWDGTGTVKAGLFRNGTFILDLSGHLSGTSTGKQDLIFSFGAAGDIPVVGDWGSTGITKVGVYRNGQWYLDANNSHSFDGADSVYSYGMAGDAPVVGDWDGSGGPKIGVSRGGSWYLNVSGTGTYSEGLDLQFPFGFGTFKYLVGY